jgi:hypothetical protein
MRLGGLRRPRRSITLFQSPKIPPSDWTQTIWSHFASNATIVGTAKILSHSGLKETLAETTMGHCSKFLDRRPLLGFQKVQKPRGSGPSRNIAIYRYLYLVISRYIIYREVATLRYPPYATLQISCQTDFKNF